MRKITLFAVLIFLSGTVSAQHNKVFFTGIFPEISLTKKISSQYRLNFKIENQEILFDNSDSEIDNPQFTHYRTDLMMFLNREIRPGVSIAAGLFHRIQDNENANRIIQQLAILQRMRNLRINHRFRTDQTFTKNDDFEFRFRYRFTLEIPLDGVEIDPREYYMVLSNEPIFSSKGDEFEIENRTVVALGKLFNLNEKMEWGIDYRTDGFFQEGIRTRLWAKLSYYYNF